MWRLWCWRSWCWELRMNYWWQQCRSYFHTETLFQFSHTFLTGRLVGKWVTRHSFQLHVCRRISACEFCSLNYWSRSNTNVPVSTLWLIKATLVNHRMTWFDILTGKYCNIQLSDSWIQSRLKTCFLNWTHNIWGVIVQQINPFLKNRSNQLQCKKMLL